MASPGLLFLIVNVTHQKDEPIGITRETVNVETWKCDLVCQKKRKLWGNMMTRLKSCWKKLEGNKLFSCLLWMRQVIGTRIAAMEVYIRQVEKPLMGKTGKYRSRLLRDNVQHFLLQVLRTDQGSVRNSLDAASLASNGGGKMRWTFWVSAYCLWFRAKFYHKKREKSAQVNTSRLHWITGVIIGNTHFLHCFSTKICALYRYLMYSFKSSIYSWLSSTYSQLLSSVFLAQTSLWFWKLDNISHAVQHSACTV